MTDKILIASTNRHKVEEIKEIFKIREISFISLENYEDIPEAIEDGNSFKDNALLKAKYYFKHTQISVIADD